MMSSASCQLFDHSVALPSLAEDKQATKGETKASSLNDALPNAGVQGSMRSEWRHRLGKDMLAFFILGIVVRIL